MRQLAHLVEAVFIVTLKNVQVGSGYFCSIYLITN